MSGRDPLNVVVVLSSLAMRRYQRAVAGWDLQVVDGWAELLDACPTLPPSAVLVVDCSRAHADAELSENLGRLAQEHPSLALVAALEAGRAPAGTLRTLFGCGIADVLDLELEDTVELACGRFEEARGRPFRAAVSRWMGPYLSADARQLLRGAVEVALARGGAGEFAALYGVSPVTAAKWCAGAGLPFPRTLQLWMRLLLAAFLLSEPRRTVASVAGLCGYASDRSLRRALGRLTGGSPRTFRRADAFPAVAKAFDAVLFEAREKRRALRSRS